MTLKVESPSTFWLDRRVPLMLVFAMLVQSFWVFVWAGAASERIANTESELARVEALPERAARLEAQVGVMQATLTRIETKLDRLNSESRGNP